MSKHAPDGQTQVNLFLLRSRARTKDIERRSRNLQSEHLGYEVIEEVEAAARASIHAVRDIKLENIRSALFPLLARKQGLQKAVEKFIKSQSLLTDDPEAFSNGYIEMFRGRIKEIADRVNRDRFERLDFKHWAQGVQDRQPAKESGSVENAQADEDDQDPRVHTISSLRVNNARECLILKAIEQRATEQAGDEIVQRWVDASKNPDESRSEITKHLQADAEEIRARRMNDHDLQVKWDEWFEKTQFQGADDIYPGYSNQVRRGPR